MVGTFVPVTPIHELLQLSEAPYPLREIFIFAAQDPSSLLCHVRFCFERIGIYSRRER